MGALVKFWGTRGSVPTPGSATRVYGGNTACVEIRWDEALFICDAGSGIRELGQELMTRPGPLRANMLFSHPHWDHIQGFPFFAPAYDARNHLVIYGPESGDDRVFRLLSGQMGSDYFPVKFKDLQANICSASLAGGEQEIDGVLVESFPLNHPGGCHGYKLSKDGIQVAYMTDNELVPGPGELVPDPQDESRRTPPDALVNFVRGVDLLITDAQYSDEEYLQRQGWGHSSCVSVTDLAVAAEVRQLALFHHDPETTDSEVDSRVERCRVRASRFGADVSIFAAREGVELNVVLSKRES